MGSSSEDISPKIIGDIVNLAVEKAVSRFSMAGFDAGSCAAHAEAALRQVGRELAPPDRVYPALAFFGTTSAGKTSLVNALIGSDLAPSDPRELSSGILSFRHGTGQPRVWTHGTPKGCGVAGYARHLAATETQAHIEAHLQALRLQREHASTDKNLKIGRLNIEVETDLSDLSRFLGLSNPHSLVLHDLPGLRIDADERVRAELERYASTDLPVIVTSYVGLFSRERQESLASLLRARSPFLAQEHAPIVVLNRVDEQRRVNTPLDTIVAEHWVRWSELLEREVRCVPCSAHLIAAGVHLTRLEHGCAPQRLDWVRDVAEAALERISALERADHKRLRRIWRAIEDGEEVPGTERRWLGSLCLRVGGGNQLATALRESLESFGAQAQLPSLLQKAVQRRRSKRKPKSQHHAIDAVVSCLSAVMHSDEVADIRERRLVSSLSREFCERFTPDVQPPPPRESLPAATDIKAQLKRARLNGTEKRWLLAACELVLAVDGVHHPSEREMVQFITRSIR